MNWRPSSHNLSITFLFIILWSNNVWVEIAATYIPSFFPQFFLVLSTLLQDNIYSIFFLKV